MNCMLFSRKVSVEDRIVELTLGNRMSVKELFRLLGKERGLSLRAVYKAVNKLVVAGVLLKVGSCVMVDHEWMLRTANHLLTPLSPHLSRGERVVYTFGSISHLDAFWKTTVLPLEHSDHVREVFFYNPHNFWAYLPDRKESEDAYYRHFSEKKVYGFFTVGAESLPDREFKRAYQNDFLQIDLRDIDSISRTDHVSVLGPFVVTVRLAKDMSERIDQLYASGKPIEQLVPGLIKICTAPGKIRFVLENNPARADKMRRLLARNFYFRDLRPRNAS